MSQVDSSSAKKSTELTLIDKLSRLSYQQTLKLLGSDGPKLLRAGDSWDFRIEEDVYLNEDLFRLKFPLAPGETESPPVVTISLMDPSNGRLRWNCTVCESLCEHTVDRKSTRLNSSHGYISYAVFCLKKKNLTISQTYMHDTHA